MDTDETRMDLIKDAGNEETKRLRIFLPFCFPDLSL
jgi:hypothetical protein